MIDGTISAEGKIPSDPQGGPVPDNGNDDSLGWADWLSFALTSTLALSIYLLTLAPDVTLGFSGIFSTAATHGGVPHPPGYPLSTIYSWLFVKLIPVSTVAWRVAAASAIAGAAACGVIAMIVSRLGTALVEPSANGELRGQHVNRLRAAAGCCAGLAFGFSNAFWRRAVIADVWTVSVLSLCLVLLLLLRWSQALGRKCWLYCAFLAYGLALTNSQALLAFGPAIPFFVMVGNRDAGRDAFLCGTVLCGAGLVAAFCNAEPALGVSRLGIQPVLAGYISIGLVVAAMAVFLSVATRRLLTEWKTALISGTAFLLGLSLYFYVPLASMTNPPMNWGYPRTMQGFFHVLSRGQYERINPPTDVAQYSKQLWLYLDATGSSFGWLNLAVAIIPLALIRRMPSPERNWLIASVAALLCLGPLLIVVLNPAPDQGSRESIGVFTSLSCVILAIWMGIGLIQIGNWHLARSRLH